MPQITPSLPQDGNSAVVSSVNDTFNQIISLLNGNIGADNLSNGAISTDKVASNSITMAKLATAISGLLPTTGDYRFSVNSTPKSGELLCDGSAVSRTTYSALYTAIGNGFGSGDGTTTFNLPNLKGKDFKMVDVADPDFTVLGKTGGENTHTLTAGEMPVHAHTLTDPGHIHGVTDPGHTHSLSYPVGNYPNHQYSGTGLNPIDADENSLTINSSTTGVSIQSHNTGITMANAGSGTAHNNLPNYVTAGYVFIRS